MYTGAPNIMFMFFSIVILVLSMIAGLIFYEDAKNTRRARRHR